jgi:peptide-methionine (R)-S-oxide reductase
MHRRNILRLGAIALLWPGLRPAQAGGEGFAVTLTEAEWRARLTPLQYAVLREEETERAGTSPLDKETRAGTYHCAGCDLAVYASEHKYDSGTGWPSFWQALPKAVGTKEDNSFCSPPGPRCIASAVVAISGISSAMGRSRRGCAIA